MYLINSLALHSCIMPTKDSTRCSISFLKYHANDNNNNNNNIQDLHSSGVRKTPDVGGWVSGAEVLDDGSVATDAPSNVSRDVGRSAARDASRDASSDGSIDEGPITSRKKSKCRSLANRGVVDFLATRRVRAAGGLVMVAGRLVMVAVVVVVVVVVVLVVVVVVVESSSSEAADVECWSLTTGA